MHTSLEHNINQAHVRQCTQYHNYPSVDSFNNALAYVIEEVVEVKKELTNGAYRYKPFKPSVPINRDALASELADLYITTMNVLALSGLEAEIIVNAVEAKLAYNKTRTDHFHQI